MGVFRYRFVGPAEVPGDLPEARTLCQQLVNQGMMGAAAFGIGPVDSARRRLAGTTSTGSSELLCRATQLSTAVARFFQRWNRSATLAVA